MIDSEFDYYVRVRGVDDFKIPTEQFEFLYESFLVVVASKSNNCRYVAAVLLQSFTRAQSSFFSQPKLRTRPEFLSSLFDIVSYLTKKDVEAIDLRLAYLAYKFYKSHQGVTDTKFTQAYQECERVWSRYKPFMTLVDSTRRERESLLSPLSISSGPRDSPVSPRTSGTGSGKNSRSRRHGRLGGSGKR